ncbi:hypothetical protein BLAT2472_50081 [Burkholderia latens]
MGQRLENLLINRTRIMFFSFFNISFVRVLCNREQYSSEVDCYPVRRFEVRLLLLTPLAGEQVTQEPSQSANGDPGHAPGPTSKFTRAAKRARKLDRAVAALD